jgi:hypothetical protein
MRFHLSRPFQPRRHRGKRRQHSGVEVPVDPDHVQRGRWFHDAMVEIIEIVLTDRPLKEE